MYYTALLPERKIELLQIQNPQLHIKNPVKIIDIAEDFPGVKC